MAIIYCIVCNITGEKYYGSSKKTLEKRMSYHKCKSNRCCSRHIILRGDYDSYILAEYETIEEAEMKEDWYIDNKECINEQRVRLTDEERLQKEKIYREKNREKKSEYLKEYYEKNREKIKEKEKIYREKNSEKIKEYKKKYREQNSEKDKEYQKIYYKKNREKVNCEFCKKQMCRKSLTRHKKLLHFN